MNPMLSIPKPTKKKPVSQMTPEEYREHKRERTRIKTAKTKERRANGEWNIGELIDEVADPLFSLFTRMKDADDNGMVKCCTCETFVHWLAMNGDKRIITCGHLVTRECHPIRWYERNAHGQCYICNGNSWAMSGHGGGGGNGRYPEHSQYILDRYGIPELQYLISFKTHRNAYPGWLTIEKVIDVIKMYLPQVLDQAARLRYDIENEKKTLLNKARKIIQL